MSNIVKKTIKKSFINRHAGEAVQYAIKMEREGAKLLGVDSGSRMLQLTHEVDVEEDLEVNIKDEGVEATTETIAMEEAPQEEPQEETSDTPEDVTEPEVLEDTSEGEATAIDLDYAETLDKDDLLSYLKGVDKDFESKAKSAKSILKAAKKHFNV